METDTIENSNSENTIDNNNNIEINEALELINKYSKDFEKYKEQFIRFQERYKRELCRYSYFIWRMKIDKNYQVSKDIKLSISDYNYQVGMLSENLNRLILNLDNVETYGNSNVRSNRKGLIQQIQNMIDENDNFFNKTKHLKQLYMNKFFKEDKIQQPQNQQPQNDNIEEDNESISTESSNEDNQSIEQDNQPIKEPQIKEQPTQNQNNQPTHKHHSHKRQRNRRAPSPLVSLRDNRFTESNKHINRKWTPRYRFTKNNNNLILQVELPYVKEENIEISLDPDDNNISISGMRNLQNMYSRYSNKNADYDYFELNVPVELDQIDKDNISYEFHNSILYIILPQIVRHAFMDYDDDDNYDDDRYYNRRYPYNNNFFYPGGFFPF